MILRAGYKANRAVQAAMVWLLRVVAKGIIKVAKQPHDTT
jgi:hypothetical protein